MFVRIGNKMVSRYTETFRITEECNEKDLKKIGNLKKLSELDINSENIKSLDFVYDLSSLKKINIGYAPNLDMSFFLNVRILKHCTSSARLLTALSI